MITFTIIFYLPTKNPMPPYEKKNWCKKSVQGLTKGLDGVLKAAGEEEEGPGVLQSIYNYIFGQEGIQYYKGLPENLKTAEEDIKAGKKSNVLQCKDRGLRSVGFRYAENSRRQQGQCVAPTPIKPESNILLLKI